MNPDLNRLQPYPFEKLAKLKAGCQPPADRAHIALSIGEPKHATPAFIHEALTANLAGLANYPVTRGSEALRNAIAAWLIRRFSLSDRDISADRNILPVNGTREALFSFAQAVVDRSRDALVLMPNPFYQIYEGAAYLAGATPWFMNSTEENQFIPEFDRIPDEVWKRCQLLFICSPGNPTGAVTSTETLQQLIELADRHDFIIASDECYSELYTDEDKPPAGLLGAAQAMGRTDYARCVVFHSLSKRSNAPGLRSGFVAGDARVLEKFLLYRTYHGCAMPPPTQAASTAAWQDEEHVRENRELYRQKFRAVVELLSPVLNVSIPAGGFYLWPKTPLDDTEFTRMLFHQQNVTVLPGSYLSREAHGINPGHQRIRMALVAETRECIDAAQRIRTFIESL